MVSVGGTSDVESVRQTLTTSPVNSRIHQNCHKTAAFYQDRASLKHIRR
jgi:hypothetical protein